MMFTPSRQWPGRSMAPKSEERTKRHPAGNYEITALMDGPPPQPPPIGLLSDTAKIETLENMEDWRRFREAGFLDEAALERRDRDALQEKVGRLERELFNYQHNMGLLLIEKKEWTFKCEELQESLLEAQEVLKRDMTVNLIAVSQVKEREENLRKALEIERHHVSELESSLRELNSVPQKTKMASELAGGVRDKSLEVQRKLVAADSKLCEAHRRSLELERKLQEVETRKSVLKRERMSFISERDAHEETFMKHKEDMLECEKEMKERERRLSQNMKHMHERDEKVNQLTRVIMEREKEFEVERKEVEISSSTRKKKEEDINRKLAELIEKEEKAESMRSSVEEQSETEMIALTEKLSSRERVEIQSILDEHRTSLALKEEEFESEIEEKRKLLDEELKVKFNYLDKKAIEINHTEEKWRKQEQALEKKLGRVKEKEKEVESKLKDLKERGKGLKMEEKNQEKLRKETVIQKNSLKARKDEVEQLKSENEQNQLQIQEETRKLSIVDEERKEHDRLIRNLRQEIEKHKHMKDLVCKESAELKQDWKKFKQEWGGLHEKRAELTRDMQQIELEKEIIEKSNEPVQKQLEEKKMAIETNLKGEKEKIMLEKESFDARMRHELSELSENAQLEHKRSLEDFEIGKRDLETTMRNKREEMEIALQVKASEFEEKKESENHHITCLKKLVEKELDAIYIENKRLEKERQNNECNKGQLKEQQFEMQKDINELCFLSQRLKLQREQFHKENSQLASFIDILINCQNCGDIMRDYMLSNLRNSELDGKGTSPLFEKVAAQKKPHELDPKSSGSGRHISWFFHKFLSPANRIEDLPSRNLDQALSEAQVLTKEGPSVPVGTTDEVDGQKEESRGNSTIPRKRALGVLAQSSKINSGYKSESHLESVVVDGGGHRKRHQKGPPAVQNAGKQRYNLRHHTNRKYVAASADTERKKDKEVLRDDELNSSPPGEVTSSQLGNTAELVQDTSYKNAQTQVVSVDRVVRCQASSDNINETGNGVNMEEHLELSEGVSGTPEYNSEELVDDDEDEEDNPGQASIPRKIWSFFTL